MKKAKEVNMNPKKRQLKAKERKTPDQELLKHEKTDK
jgi:hypothetical protein